jgi:nucleotide-binding universal stress UspA family protein
MYKTLVVPLDGSKLAECVLPHVETLAKGCHVENIIFLRMVEPFSRVVAGDYQVFSQEQINRINSEMISEAKGYLQELLERLRYNGVKTKSEVIVGRPAEGIAEYATKANADLIIIATHGHSGLSRWVWGSVADRTLRSSCVPVLMVRAPGCIPGF